MSFPHRPPCRMEIVVVSRKLISKTCRLRYDIDLPAVDLDIKQVTNKESLTVEKEVRVVSLLGRAGSQLSQALDGKFVKILYIILCRSVLYLSVKI